MRALLFIKGGTDMYENYLAHYGILGMRWGVRRYQNRDGSLTAEGRKRLGIKDSGSPRHAPSNAQKRSRQEHAEAERVRKEAEAKEQREKEKKLALEKGTAADVLKFKGELTNKEMQDAVNRINLEKQLSSLSKVDVKSTWDKMDSLVNTAVKIKDYANKGIEMYNLIAKVHNSFASENEQMKLIDGNSTTDEKKKAEQKRVDRLLRTGSAEEILEAAKKGRLSDADLGKAVKRFNAEKALNDMMSPKDSGKKDRN